MAGTLVADTLQDGAGNSTAMDNAIYGSAKAWVNFNGSSSTTINASYNVSSITYISSGSYTINFTNALADAKYVMAGTCVWDGSNYLYITIRGTAPTSSACNIYTNSSSSTGNAGAVSIAFFR
jgi:hypothetical protein